MAVAIALSLLVSGAHAATIALSPTTADVPPGSQVSFDFIANFGTESTSGGAVDFQWDPAVLTLVDFAFDQAFGEPPRDPALNVEDKNRDFPPDTQDELGYVAIGFGTFATAGISIPNDTKIGTLTFNVVGASGTQTDITLRDSVKWAGFFNGVTFQPITTTYTGAHVGAVPIGAVPIPAAAWLLLSGFAGLFGMARRRSRAS